MSEYNHIEITRENDVRPYRFHSNPTTPKPPIRNKSQHGKKLKTQLESSFKNIMSTRRDMGIQSENLVVLEITSDAISPSLLEEMIRKFNVYLVEEIAIPNSNRSRLTIQFESKKDIDAFNEERLLWEIDDPNDNLLTYSSRRDIFNCIDNIRNIIREDRIGPKLKKYYDNNSFPNNLFIVDIDVWFNGNQNNVLEIEAQINKVLGTEGSRLLGDLFQIPSMLLGRAEVNEFTLNALLDMDIISMVELPYKTESLEPSQLYQIDYNPIMLNYLEDDAPLATVLDSGIYTANPLLQNIIIAEEQFDFEEPDTTDYNGHGTGVAGIVVYGDLDKCIKDNKFQPLVRVCNGKIMHDENGDPTFPQEKRPEQIVKEAIEYFYNNYTCRIFNLSAGDINHLYNNGRQFAWAEMLDQLVRDLDIVIVVSAGNVSEPEMNDFSNRDELMENCRDRLFYPEHKLIDPATAVLAITVGSITRYDEPMLRPHTATRIAPGRRDYPSVFTRIGQGVNKSIKPDFVDYGGNYAISQMPRGTNRWVQNDIKLLEPTLNNTAGNIFKRYCGTSFSAPHVTHVAARVERALEKQLNDKPSANLIRAMVANSARYSPEMVEWAEKSKDVFYTGQSNPKQERRLRLYGYGKIDDSLLYSDDNRVTLFAEDKLPLRSFHLYKIPVPTRFLQIKADKTISVSMAYNPITRLSRKDYLSNNLWFEIFRKIDEDTLVQYKVKKERGENADEYLETLPDQYKTAFSPGSKSLRRGTLQQSIWQKGPRGGGDLLWDENDPYIYILVTGKEKFRYAEQEMPQEYALVVTFSYNSREDIQLYNSIKENVKIKTRIKERTRMREKL